ncbi:hypothetical protein KIPB_013326 [Kipferlia bialata]|uniref:Helicase ATP-binding domain-containing protein n=1 Tax=Kipferlia bialata TaxID=797122 RepID=A0A9K3GPG3_9EUKA|nr:hypothetical protein KIPB_013326 [Kipferlia bialata]|eukprot:g13326.t1
MGNGVYTTADPSIANMYAGQSGSLVVMRGLLSTDLTTQSTSDIFIYTKPDQLLCVAIVDFAADTESRDAAAAAAAQADRERARERAAMMAEMEQRERDHERNMVADWRAMMRGYIRSLQDCRQRVAPEANPSMRTQELVSHHIVTEQRQFESHLPVYLHKWRFDDDLRHHDILLVSAPTGSGKSTQLPQYIVDSIFPSDKRKVAVLEPRRVNCTSLAEQVTSERGGILGGEVGYSMGGQVRKLSHTTRIEYITHGLFARYTDCTWLRKNYCAIIVDEAHERTLEVDMSLALIKRTLSCAGDSLKLVICSATLGGDVIDSLRYYIDPSGTKSKVLTLPSHSFPVHVMYRDQSLLQPSDSTTTTGRVLTSAAVDTALQLFQESQSGNILVFLPGKYHLGVAFECLLTQLQSSSLTAPKKGGSGSWIGPF